MTSKVEYVAEATKIIRNFFGGALGAVTMGMSLRWETERELKRLEAKISKKDKALRQELQKSKEIEENFKMELQKSKEIEENFKMELQKSEETFKMELQKSKETEEYLKQEINKLKWFWNR